MTPSESLEEGSTSYDDYSDQSAQSAAVAGTHPDSETHEYNTSDPRFFAQRDDTKLDELENRLMLGAALSSNFPFTFGVEIEFGVGASPDPNSYRWDDPRPYACPTSQSGRQKAQENLRRDIATLLRKHGIPAWVSRREIDSDIVLEEMQNKLAMDSNCTAAEIPNEWGESSMFRVYEDWSVMSSETPDYNGQDGEYDDWLNVEIKTPILYHAPDSLDMIKLVCQVITSHFPCGINHETNLHVHVGRGTSGFTLVELKRIMSFLFVASDRLDQLHPPHQGPRCMWAPGIRLYSMLVSSNEDIYHLKRGRWPTPKESSNFVVPNPYHQDGPVSNIKMLGDSRIFLGDPPDSSDALQRIWAAKNTRDLLDLVRNYKDPGNGFPNGNRGAYNTLGLYEIFNDLQSSDELYLGRKPTIEFRQGHGSLDGNHICQWTTVCVGIIRFCISAHIARFVELISKLNDCRDPNEQDTKKRYAFQARCPETKTESDYTIYDLLRDIDLEEQAEYFEKLGLYPLPPAPFSFEGTQFKREKVGNQLRWVPINLDADKSEDELAESPVDILGADLPDFIMHFPSLSLSRLQGKGNYIAETEEHISDEQAAGHESDGNDEDRVQSGPIPLTEGAIGSLASQGIEDQLRDDPESALSD